MKKGNTAKSFKTYVTGLKEVWVYATSTNSSDKTFVVTATDAEGNAITESGTSSGSQTTTIKVALDPEKKYVIDYVGTKADDNTAGDDMMLHALKFFPNAETGIEAITATEDNAPVFNLEGLRIENAVKGIYIQNGKKYVVK